MERLARHVFRIFLATEHQQGVAIHVAETLPIQRLERFVHGLGASIADSLEHLLSLSLDAHQLHHTWIDEAAERSVPSWSGGFQALGSAPLRSRASREPMRGSGPRRAMSPSAPSDRPSTPSPTARSRAEAVRFRSPSRAALRASSTALQPPPALPRMSAAAIASSSRPSACSPTWNLSSPGDLPAVSSRRKVPRSC